MTGLRSMPLIGARAGGRALLDGVDVVMLGSNDYLGLSTVPIIQVSRQSITANASTSIK